MYNIFFHRIWDSYYLEKVREIICKCQMSWLPQYTLGSMLPKLSFCHVSPLHQGGIHQPAQDLKTLSDDPKLKDK